MRFPLFTDKNKSGQMNRTKSRILILKYFVSRAIQDIPSHPGHNVQMNCSLCPRTDHFSAGCDPGPVARNPPSTMILDPDTKEAPSEATNKIADVVSRTFPMRNSGYCLAICF